MSLKNIFGFENFLDAEFKFIHSVCLVLLQKQMYVVL